MNLFDLAAVITLDKSQYEQGLNEAQGQAEGFGSKLKSGLSAAAGVAGTAITAATGAMVKFGSDAINVGKEFDSSMSQVAATLGLTTDDIKNNVDGAGDTFQALRDKAQEMGAATNFSASQAAEGLNILAMSGFDAEQSISMVEDVLHLAAAGSMDMAQAAGYISGAMKGFNDETKDSGYYADLMAKGATLANTSVSQLGDAMASGAAGAAAYNQNAESMTVALLRLAEQGDVGAAAGTALSAAMKDLYTPSDQAAKALKKLGVAAYTESGEARDFNVVVNELSAALSGMTDEEAAAYKQTIFGIQGLNAFNKMTVTGIDKQNEWADALSKASDGAGEAAKQYETMTDNLQGDIDIWNSAMDGLKIAVSDKLMPTVREFVQFGSESISTITKAFQEDGLSGAMEALGDIISDGLNMIIGMLPDVVKAGTELLNALVSGIVDNLPQIADAAIRIVESLIISIGNNLPKLASGFQDAFSKIVEKLTSGDFLYIFAGVGIMLINQLADGLVDGIPEFISRAGEVVQNLVETFINIAPRLLDAGVHLLKSVIEGISNAIPELTESAVEIVSTIMNAITENLPTLVSTGVSLIFTIAQAIFENLPLLVEAAGEIVTQLGNFINENLPVLAGAAMLLVSGLVSMIIDNLPGLVEAGVEILNNLVSIISENIGLLAEAALLILTAIVTAVVENLPTLVEAATSILENLVALIAENIPILLDAALEIMQGLSNAILDNLPLIIDSAVAIVTQIVDTIIENLPEFLEAALEIIVKLAEGLIEHIPELVESAVEIVTRLVEFLCDNVDMLIDASIEIIIALAEGLIESLPSLLEKAPEIIASLVDAIIENVPKLLDAAIEIIIKLAGYIAEQFPEIVKKGTEIIDSLIDGIKQVIQTLFNWGADLINKVIEGTDSKIQEFKTIGDNIVKGIWKGISDGYEWIAGKISGWVGDVLGFFKRLFGIASPSKEFKKFGKFIVEGLGEGIEDNTSITEKATKGMADSVSDSMEIVVDKLEEILDQVTQLVKQFSKEISDAAQEAVSDAQNMASAVNSIVNSGVVSSSGMRINYDSTSPAWIGGGSNQASAEWIASLGWKFPDNVQASASSSQSSGNSYVQDRPIVITVNSVLDGKKVGESTYKYAQNQNNVLGRYSV